MVCGGWVIVPTLNGEHNLAGFRVKRFPSALTFGTYKVPVTSLGNAKFAFGASSMICDGHTTSCGSISVFEFPDVRLTMECDGCCALRDIPTEGDNKTYKES